MAESTLGDLDLEMAEKAFVHSKDFQGIQFVKRLKKLDVWVVHTYELHNYKPSYMYTADCA